MAEASSNPAKVIDVQDGDTFNTNQDLWQCRNKKERWINWNGAEWWKKKIGYRKELPRPQALAVLKLMDYTIRELDRHGREVVARNEGTGNYVAKHSDILVAVWNPQGTHTWSISQQKWGDETKDTTRYAPCSTDMAEVLATAPAYTPAPKPEAGSVEWPTHCVRRDSGIIYCWGTEEACKGWASGSKERVLPMPRPPMSPEMRAFMEAIAATSVRDSVCFAARKLLASEATK